MRSGCHSNRRSPDAGKVGSKERGLAARLTNEEVHAIALISGLVYFVTALAEGAGIDLDAAASAGGNSSCASAKKNAEGEACR